VGRILYLAGGARVDIETGVLSGRARGKLPELQRAFLASLWARPGEVVGAAALHHLCWRHLPAPRSASDHQKMHGRIYQTAYELRRKLERTPKHPRFILKRGEGYLLDPTGGLFGAEIPAVRRTNIWQEERAGFIGRAGELAELTRLVEEGGGTFGISGAAGIGKTALIERLALGLSGRFRGGGVWRISVRGAADEDDLWRRAIAALGLSVSGEDRLARALQRRGRTLLIVDDLDAAPALAGPLLALSEGLPRLTLALAARSRGVLPETIPVSALGALSETLAAQLFTDRAAAALGRAPAPALVEAAAALGGAPGAIVLAAAAAEWWGEDGLIEQLDRLRVDAPGPLGEAMARMVEGAWARCSGEERDALLAAAVAAGPLTGAAAAALGIAPGVLGAVCDRGLLMRRGDRYAIPIEVESCARRAGADRLAGAEGARAAWALARGAAIHRAARLHEAEALAELRALAPELLETEARARSAERAAEALLLALPALALDDPAGVIPRLDRALERGGLSATSRARLRLERGGCLLRDGQPSFAERDLRAVAGDPEAETASRLRARIGLGQAALSLGDHDAAERHLLGAARDAGEEEIAWLEGRARAALAILYRRLERRAEADAAHRAAMRCARRAGDLLTEVRALGNLALSLRRRGELDEARAVSAREIALHRRCGDRRAALIAEINQGNLLMDLGEPDGARVALEGALGALAEVSAPELEAAAEGDLALVDLLDGDQALAMERLHRARAICQECDAPAQEAIVCIQLAIAAASVGDRPGAIAALDAATRCAEVASGARERAWIAAILYLLESGPAPPPGALPGWLDALLAEPSRPRSPQASISEQLLAQIASRYHVT